MKRKYLIYFIASYFVVGITARFSLIAAYILLALVALFLAIPLYKFVKEREGTENKKEKSKFTTIGNIFTFLGVFLASAITLNVIFQVIRFIFVLIVIFIKGMITNS